MRARPSAKPDAAASAPKMCIRDRVTDWVCSQAADARYVEVPRGQKREEPIVVSVSADEGGVADTGVMVREGAECTIVVAASGAGKEGTSASLLRVIAGARSRVSIVEVLGVGEGQQHLESVGISAGDDARVEVRQYALDVYKRQGMGERR